MPKARSHEYILPLPPSPPRFRKVAVWGLVLFVVWLSIRSYTSRPRALSTLGAAVPTVKERLADALRAPLNSSEFPSEIPVHLGEVETRAGVIYSLDWQSQTFMEKLFKAYRPDYGAFVAMDATTGQILSLVSYSRNANDLGHLALKATYPAASIFKIVTAAAAIDRNRMTPETEIAYNGGNHTLYKRNVTGVLENRWTRRVTLSEAFAKSINSVFAKVGLYRLQPPDLMEYASRFQFNQPIPSDMPVEKAFFDLPENDEWAIAEAASGFNRIATLSPLQGALMAAAVANDGVMMSPYLVERMFATEEGLLYNAQPAEVAVAVSPETAKALRTLMHDTVKIGTSRSVFRQLFRKKGYDDLDVGGKTGSLAGFSPKGKYDWFVGYARRGDRKIAVSALTINEEKWQVKSSYLAKEFIAHYFKGE